LRNIRLTLEFDGAGFFGWQFQADRPTVQGAVESALSGITGSATKVYGCSRTDAGVSARNYVANFHTSVSLPAARLMRALDYHLPRAIHVRAAEEVAAGFHARFDAVAKTYRYRMVRGKSPLRHARAWELRYPVDAARMRRAAAEFVGTRDFQPFCQTRDKSGTCRVKLVELLERDDELELVVRGDRFLYKMVRRITGAVVGYGHGRLTLDDIRSALAGHEHTQFRTAPAAGLLLDSVEY